MRHTIVPYESDRSSYRLKWLSFFLLYQHPLRSTLFPYTTLFRSCREHDPLADNHHFPPGDANRVDLRLHQRADRRSEEHTSELQSLTNLVCRLLLEKKK